jgi:AcrR family transcriptional regulator
MQRLTLLPMPTTPSPIELPVLGSEPRQRADAVRNRALILSTAERLFREKGVENVSMDAIACGAGVGKGTLFRRFGDRASLVRALLEEGESDFQESFIRGAPPLGPGAPPAERLIAFGHGVLDFAACHGEFLLAAESGGVGVRFRSSVYAAHHAHVRMLVRAGAPEVDADYTADALLSTLAAELVMHQTRGRGIALEDLKDGWAALVRRVIA